MRAVAAAPWTLECEGKGGRSSAPRVYVHSFQRSITFYSKVWNNDFQGVHHTSSPDYVTTQGQTRVYEGVAWS